MLRFVGGLPPLFAGWNCLRPSLPLPTRTCSARRSSMYHAYEKDLPARLFERIESALDFLQRSLGSTAQIITKKSDLLTVYLLASYVIQRFASRDIEDAFRDFVVSFIEKDRKKHLSR